MTCLARSQRLFAILDDLALTDPDKLYQRATMLLAAHGHIGLVDDPYTNWKPACRRARLWWLHRAHDHRAAAVTHRLQGAVQQAIACERASEAAVREWSVS